MSGGDMFVQVRPA